MVSPETSNGLQPANSGVRLTPAFWQSPFPLAAAAAILAQGMMCGVALLSGRPVPIDLIWPLALATTLILTAGLWPAWNYMTISNTGIEQHAGLSHLKIDFVDIKSVRAGAHGVDIHYIETGSRGPHRLTKARVFNRYGVSAETLHRIIDEAWERAAEPAFS